MEILTLTLPASEKEVREMHVINQENIPEVGGLADINDFNARVCWSSNIFTYKSAIKPVGTAARNIGKKNLFPDPLEIQSPQAV